MGVKRAALPEPSGCGNWFVMLMLICLLLAMNSILTTGLYSAFEPMAPNWLRYPRTGQFILFLTPLALLLAELGLMAAVGRLARRVRHEAD
jgi:hypothetical protein